MTLTLYLTKHHAMKTYWGSEGIARSTHFLSWYYMEVNGQLRAQAALPQGRTTSTHWIGSLVGPRAGPERVAKRKIPSPRRESNPDRQARSLVSIPTELSRFL
jgi:hypothetical protein